MKRTIEKFKNLIQDKLLNLVALTYFISSNKGVARNPKTSKKENFGTIANG